MVAWFKLSSLNSNQEIFSKTDELGKFGHAFGWGLKVTSGNCLQAIIGTIEGWKFLSSSTVLEANVWYQVAFASDQATAMLYLNGILDSTISIVGGPNHDSSIVNPGSHDIGIGVLLSNYPLYFFNGTIDDVRLYNRALSNSVIQQLYNDV